jgi:hypothetical protein
MLSIQVYAVDIDIFFLKKNSHRDKRTFRWVFRVFDDLGCVFCRVTHRRYDTVSARIKGALYQPFFCPGNANYG